MYVCMYIYIYIYIPYIPHTLYISYGRWPLLDAQTIASTSRHWLEASGSLEIRQKKVRGYPP